MGRLSRVIFRRFGGVLSMLILIAGGICGAFATRSFYNQTRTESVCLANLIARDFPFLEYATPSSRTLESQRAAITQAEAVAYLAIKRNTDPQSGKALPLCAHGYVGEGGWIQEARAFSFIRRFDPTDPNGAWWNFIDEVGQRIATIGWYTSFPRGEYACATTFTTTRDYLSVTHYNTWSLTRVGKPIGGMVLLGPKDCKQKRWYQW